MTLIGQLKLETPVFYGTTAGLEIFIPGGISISMNGYIRLFDKDKKVTGLAVPQAWPTLELTCGVQTVFWL